MFRVDHEDVAGGSRGLKYIFKQIIVYSDGHNSDNQSVAGLINVLIIYSFSLNQNPDLFMLENCVHGWNIWICPACCTYTNSGLIHLIYDASKVPWMRF